MRKRLRDKAEVIEVLPDLSRVTTGHLLVSIFNKEDGDVPAQSGLRSASKVSVRANQNDIIQVGSYLAVGTRLFHVVSNRDGNYIRDGVFITADEFIGRKATYTPSGGIPGPCRVHLTHDAPYFDDFGKITSYRIKAEVLLLEVGRPQSGDKIRIGSVDYVVTQYANDTDDAVVRGLWLDIA